MSNNGDISLRRKIELYLPRIIREYLKRIYWRFVRFGNICFYMQKGKLVELGYHFRFSRIPPYTATLGDETILEEFNIWNAKMGNISVGKKCWFGLHNIIMGPVSIGNNVLTGPHVTILGPKHAREIKSNNSDLLTIIGDNVWISTGAIILFGVKIGDNAVIGPGSVVMNDVPADAYVAGNPARNLSKIAAITWNK